MSIKQVGRGRATGLGSADLSTSKGVKQAKQKVLHQNAGAEIAKPLTSLQKVSPQRMQAKQTVVDRAKMAFWSSVGRVAADLTTFNVRSPQSLKSHLASNDQVKASKAAMVKEMVGTITKKLDSFPVFREKRSNDPAAATTYAKFLKYAALENPEMSGFLNAMDNLRASPTVKKAEAMLREFIVPAKIDENGVPLQGQSNMQINLSSDEVRNALINAAKHSILEAHAYGTPEKLGNLVKVFERAETYIANQLDRNCKFQTEVNSAFAKLQSGGAAAPRLDPSLKV